MSGNTRIAISRWLAVLVIVLVAVAPDVNAAPEITIQPPLVAAQELP